jgi:hypothetical protein
MAREENKLASRPIRVPFRVEELEEETAEASSLDLLRLDDLAGEEVTGYRMPSMESSEGVGGCVVAGEMASS